MTTIINIVKGLEMISKQSLDDGMFIERVDIQHYDAGMGFTGYTGYVFYKSGSVLIVHDNGSMEWRKK